jgi:hypothetical protein
MWTKGHSQKQLANNIAVKLPNVFHYPLKINIYGKGRAAAVCPCTIDQG